MDVVYARNGKIAQTAIPDAHPVHLWLILFLDDLGNDNHDDMDDPPLTSTQSKSLSPPDPTARAFPPPFFKSLPSSLMFDLSR